MASVFQAVIVAAKFVVPMVMLYLPWLGMWSNYILDIVDGDLLQALGMSDWWYQRIDKSADLFSYLIMWLMARHWQVARLITILFAYRIIGQLLFFATGDEIWFVYFQNFLEPFLLIYSLIVWRQKSEKKAYAVYLKHWKLIWAVVVAYKLWNEWYLHWANIDLSLLIFGINGNQV